MKKILSPKEWLKPEYNNYVFETIDGLDVVYEDALNLMKEYSDYVKKESNKEVIQDIKDRLVQLNKVRPSEETWKNAFYHAIQVQIEDYEKLLNKLK